MSAPSTPCLAHHVYVISTYDVRACAFSRSAGQIAAVSSAALQAVEGTLTLLVTPVKAGVRLGIQHVRLGIAANTSVLLLNVCSSAWFHTRACVRCSIGTHTVSNSFRMRMHQHAYPTDFSAARRHTARPPVDQQGKEAVATIKAQQQPKPSTSWGPPPPPTAAQEVFGALKSAVGTVVGAAVSNGKAVAVSGSGALQDVVAHRYGQDVASVSNEGLRAVVTVIQTVAAVKTFGAVNLARHTVEETAKGLVSEHLGGGEVRHSQ